jgi:hypothetical protein
VTRAPIAIVLVFVCLTVALTWPLPARLTTGVAGDYGDPLFISWVMSWVADRVTAAITQPSDLRTFWDAGIFFPERRALTFSEHFIPQTLMVLPVYWLTGNAILCYNLVFLASFVLTGVGTALLGRALTGSASAGILAGVVASFNEYRLVWEVAHLQTLSIYWFPFVLLGLHVYLASGSRRALAGAAAAWVALNLSSVYYLAYCAPFVLLFTLAETWRLGRWRDVRAWRDLTVAGAVATAATVPWLIPYATTQRTFGFARTLQEVIAHSATIDNYRVALPRLAAPLALAIVALAGAIVAAAREAKLSGHDGRDSGLTARGLAGSTAIALTLAIVAVWLSFGPVVQSGGQPAALPAIYPVLSNLPGYSGLRVPARSASIFLVFLGVLAALGATFLARRRAPVRAAIAIVAIGIFLWQGREQRVPLDQPLPSAGLRNAPAYLTPASTLPPIYQAVRELPASAVLVEFPFGDPWYETRYMFFAAMHKRRLMNGYSGVFPPSYQWRQGSLWRPMRDSDRARAALGGATHAIVHGSAWPDAYGAAVAEWLVQQGARLVSDAGEAQLYVLPPTAEPPAEPAAR